MPKTTENLGLYMKDPIADGNDTFNIKTMMNDNWEIVDEVVGEQGERIEEIDTNIGDKAELVTNAKKIVEAVNEVHGMVVEDNLLINPNFKISELINQRGKSEYVGSGYCIDMWKVASNFSGIVDLTGEYLKLITDTTDIINPYYIFYQPIENYKDYEGKEVTLRFNMRSRLLTKFSVSVRVDGIGISIATKIQTTEEFDDFIFTFTLPDEINSELNFRIYFEDSRIINELELNFATLNFGDKATAKYQNNPTLELLKCQRYFYQINNLKLIRASGIMNNILYFYIKVPVKMRVKPTLLFGTEGVDWDIPYLGITVPSPLKGFVLSVSGGYDKDGVLLIATKNSHGMSDGSFRTLTNNNFFSSEI